MASVSGSGGGESIVRLKEQFQTRERETDEKHRDELTQIKRGYQAEMDRMATDNNKHIHEIRDDNQIKLTDKDVQYQKEIDSLRAMYERKLADAKAST